jgi:pantoate--beta-alanine ligase
MEIFSEIADIRAYLSKQKNKKIGFVPTMGGLHQGHLALVESIKKHCDLVVASIFVNPAQFGDNEDFSTYPRVLESDQEKLKNLNVDVLFLPSVETIYPKDSTLFIDMGKISTLLCGKSRPNFFNGIALVITKLFNIIQPDVAIFGEKDFQQLTLIKQLVRDLNLETKILSCATIREDDGLAMSSRNIYLSESERKIAPSFFQTLKEVKIDSNLKMIEKELSKNFIVDYLKVLDSNTLDKITVDSKEFIVISAVVLGKTRLIDNIIRKIT